MLWLLTTSHRGRVGVWYPLCGVVCGACGVVSTPTVAPDASVVGAVGCGGVLWDVIPGILVPVVVCTRARTGCVGVGCGLCGVVWVLLQSPCLWACGRASLLWVSCPGVGHLSVSLPLSLLSLVEG